MSTHDIHLEDTRIGHAIRETAEDIIAAVRRHYEDLAVEDKASTATIKLKFVPDKRRQQYGWELTTTTSFSPRKSCDGTFYANINHADQVVMKEYDPEQMTFEDVTS